MSVITCDSCKRLRIALSIALLPGRPTSRVDVTAELYLVDGVADGHQVKTQFEFLLAAFFLHDCDD